jgi:hypothetical protein
MEVLRLRNAAAAPEGAFGAWLAQKGRDLTILAPEALEAAAMETAEAVALRGSPHGVAGQPALPEQPVDRGVAAGGCLDAVGRRPDPLAGAPMRRPGRTRRSAPRHVSNDQTARVSSFSCRAAPPSWGGTVVQRRRDGRTWRAGAAAAGASPRAGRRHRSEAAITSAGRARPCVPCTGLFR